MNDKNHKGKLADAFDRDQLGEIEEQLATPSAPAVETGDYLKSLKRIDEALHSPPPISVPQGFVQTVLSRLPDKGYAGAKTYNLRDLFMPALFVITFILSFVFADQLGLTGLYSFASSFLQEGNSSSMPVIFVALSAIGILITSWLIVSSFFGIRSRRITR